MTTRQEVLDALIAERYGPSLWWKAPEPPDDSEVAQRRRRRLMAEDFDEGAAS